MSSELSAAVDTSKNPNNSFIVMLRFQIWFDTYF